MAINDPISIESTSELRQESVAHEPESIGLAVVAPECEPLHNKRVLVTGGSLGIGRAIALSLAQSGAKVMIFSRDKQHLEDARNEAEARGCRLLAYAADQAHPKDVDSVFELVESDLGGLDILVNNAGIGGESVVDMEDWRYVVETNLSGYLACTKRAVEIMRSQGKGYIVNIGSMSAESRSADSDVYVATKCAIQGWSESLSKKLNPDGIRVTLIEPGKTGSNMIETPPEEQPEKIAKQELLMAEDIARCVEFCLTLPERCNVTQLMIRPLKDTD